MSLAVALALSSLASPVMLAQEEGLDELGILTGQVDLAGGVAFVDLPEGWYYFDEADARYIVEDEWGNPPDPEVRGLIFPPDISEDESAGWAIVVSYSEDGYIDDADASGLDYGEIMREMKAGSQEENEARAAAGYESILLIGWAEEPHYDAAEKKLYWARRMRFGSAESVTLNYDVRILGRHGALVLSAVAEDSQLDEVAAGCKEILARTEFKEGYRYADFDPAIDDVAAYGIGALLTGKVLAKAGFFKAAMLFLAKGWKLVAVVGVAIVAFGRKLFGGRRQEARA